MVLRTDVPVPEITDSKILVHIKATSLCSTDLAAFKGVITAMTTLPYIGGHERMRILWI
jgi:D-arabinose 1-dehydrogenase-like Zn-dependent alcohol dehydrogenase